MTNASGSRRNDAFDCGRGGSGAGALRFCTWVDRVWTRRGVAAPEEDEDAGLIAMRAGAYSSFGGRKDSLFGDTHM